MNAYGHAKRPAYALQRLAEEDPALGMLALWCVHRDASDGEIPAWTAGETIWYAPAFSDLAAHEQTGLAAHHILHVAFQHAARSQAMLLRFGADYDAEIYNIAADAIVNETLELAGYALPRPSLALQPLLDRSGVEVPGDGALLGRIDADSLYVLLLHQRTDGADPSQARRQRAEALKREASEQGHVADLRPGGADAAQDNSADVADWTQRLVQALEAGRAAGRGIGALGFRLSDIPRLNTPWESELRALVMKAVMQEPRQSWRRPARRWLAMEAEARRSGRPVPVFQPSLQRATERARIAVGIDSSSSVDEARLMTFAGQLAAIGRRTGAEIHALVFDDCVRSRHRLDGYNWEAEIGRIDFARKGGTSFVDVIEDARAIDPSAIVILTDLDGPCGEAPGRIPVIWAVPYQVDIAPPFGRVLDLTR